ncbi:LysE family translocator [Azorhizobium sp. AG788]|uniref:LysE family translocator n=1 Tax=Azorhizobium sp. AG788 TaxID=2183897 RepID=UPI003138C607
MPEMMVSLLAFTAAASLLTLTPGVDTALVLRTAAASGPRAGAAAGLGICLGLLGWGLGAAVGLTAILAASPVAFTALKWAGAAYLLYLGGRLLASPRSATLSAPMATTGPRDAGLAAPFRRGLLTNALNPKVGVFYMTFLPQFIPHGIAVPGFSLLLAGLHVLLSLMWFALLIALTVPLGRLLARPAVVRGLDCATGCVFVAFGLRLALAERG